MQRTELDTKIEKTILPTPPISNYHFKVLSLTIYIGCYLGPLSLHVGDKLLQEGGRVHFYSDPFHLPLGKSA